MKIALNLPIKRKWFDMIRIGEKKEEYRDCENRQVVRLYNEIGANGCIMPDGLIAIFRNGYTLGSAALAVQIVGLDLRDRDTVKHPEWGEPVRRRAHLVVKLGKVYAVGAYETVRNLAKEVCTNGK